MCFQQWLLFENFLVSSQTQIFLSDGHESSNSHLQINCVLCASYINCYVQHYFWNCILAYNLTIMVHQGEKSALWSATAIFLLASQSWMRKSLFVSKLSRSDLKDLKGTDMHQWSGDVCNEYGIAKKYLLLGRYCNYLMAAGEIFMPEILKGSRLLLAFCLERLFALSPSPHPSISRLLFITEKWYKVVLSMVSTESVAFRYSDMISPP